MKSKQISIGIIGAGPAGISLARFLGDCGYKQVTIFEKADAIGGKSWSVEYEGLIHEMGTCYSSLGYGQTLRWMKEVGIRNIYLEPAYIDGINFRDYCYNGKSGLAAATEILRYRHFWKLHRQRKLPKEVYSMPALEWLQQNNFDILIRTLHRGMTTMGYGFLEEVPLHHVLTWANPKLFITGALNWIREPVEGWQTLWRRMAKNMEVRLNCPVIRIDRSTNKPQVETPQGKFTFDELVITIPLDELAALLPVNEAEQAVIDAVEWGQLKTSLVVTKDWFQDEFLRIYKAQVAQRTTAIPGHLMAIRRTSTQKLPGKAYNGTTPGYICLQYGDGLSSEALRENLETQLKKEKVESYEFIVERLWKYMPVLRSEALRNGILDRMQKMQGQQHIWYSGSTFSHESVRDIVDFNRELVNQLVQS